MGGVAVKGEPERGGRGQGGGCRGPHRGSSRSESLPFPTSGQEGVRRGQRLRGGRLPTELGVPARGGNIRPPGGQLPFPFV